MVELKTLVLKIETKIKFNKKYMNQKHIYFILLKNKKLNVSILL